MLMFVALALAAGAAPQGEDPDGGIARAYFTGHAPHAAEIGRAAPGVKDNILVVVVDAMRPDHMSAYGYDKPTTPFIASFFRDGLTFLHHYTNAPWTRPAAASMLTGLYPSAHRTQTDKSKLPAGIPTLAQELAALGYQTAAVVGNGNADSVAGLERGFQSYVDTTTQWDGLPAAGTVYGAARKWLDEKRDPKRPFFLLLWLIDPHDPYHAPPEYERAWLPKGFTGEPRRHAHWEYHNHYPKAERDSMIALYDAAIRYMDDQTKVFFGDLDERGLLDKTSVVLTADHGEGFGEHGYYLHGYHHGDEIIRVPLLIKSRELPGHGDVLHVTQHIDLLPTLVTWAGGRPRPTLPGSDLGTLLRRPLDPGRTVLSEFNNFGVHRSALANLRWRVILQTPADAKVFDKRIPRRELLPSVNFEHEVLHVYDRQHDPLDRKNLAGAGTLPDEPLKMVKHLRAWMKAAQAPDRSAPVNDVSTRALENLRSLGYVQ